MRFSGDRGSSAVELAILGPALIILTLLIIQFALWFDAYHAALAAAREGDLVAREEAFVNADQWRTQARNAATSYYQGMDTSVLAKVSASTAQTGTMVSVTVKGSMTALVPLTISETVTGPIECFRTQVSQGTACAG
jgi:Flp pilus assembly protein TadG